MVGVNPNVEVKVGVSVNVGVLVGVGVAVVVGVGVRVFVSVGVGVNKHEAQSAGVPYIWLTTEFEDILLSSLSYVAQVFTPLILAKIVIPNVIGVPLYDKVSET